MSADKQAAYQTLYSTLHTVTLCMAPFAPFLAEHIYQRLLPYGLTTDEAVLEALDGKHSQQFAPSEPEGVAVPISVHLCRYPAPQAESIRPTLEAAVARMQNVILLGRQKRNQVKIKTKTPLARLTIIHRDQSMLDEIARLEDYIRAELNVKVVEYSTEEDRYIRLYAKPNSPVLGKRLGKEFGRFRKTIETLSSAQLNALQEQGSLALDGESFSLDDILVFREPKEGLEALSNRFISIDMDLTLNPALVREGLAREVVNRIQKTRKDSGLNVADRIDVRYRAEGELAEAIKEHAEYIKQETLCHSLETGSGDLNFDIDEHTLHLNISKR
jgi:isoleucyl-tRNA synthetase